MSKIMIISGIIVFILGMFYVGYTQEFFSLLDEETRDGLISMALFVIGANLILFGIMADPKSAGAI